MFGNTPGTNLDPWVQCIINRLIRRRLWALSDFYVKHFPRILRHVSNIFFGHVQKTMREQVSQGKERRGSKSPKERKAEVASMDNPKFWEFSVRPFSDFYVKHFPGILGHVSNIFFWTCPKTWIWCKIVRNGKNLKKRAWRKILNLANMFQSRPKICQCAQNLQSMFKKFRM